MKVLLIVPKFKFALLALNFLFVYLFDRESGAKETERSSSIHWSTPQRDSKLGLV